MFRKSFALICAATLMTACFTPAANAGCFSGLLKKCCKPACCEPAPAPSCCEPAPAPCAPACAPAPAPVCCPAPKPVCCKPAPPAKVNVTVCLVDPCTGCSKSVDVCVPACCANEKPCVSSRKGLFGRKVFTISWKCCGHSAKAVWTKCGNVKVR